MPAPGAKSMRPVNSSSPHGAPRRNRKSDRRYLRPWALALCLLLWAGHASSGPLSDPAPYEDGFRHAKEGAWERAAQTWVADGETILKQSRGEGSLRKAACFNLCATIAFERADNARAYVTWSAAVRYFLEGNTSWEAEQEALRLEAHTIDTRLKAGLTGSLPLSGNDPQQRLLEMVETLGLLTYNGPPGGLRVREVVDEEPEIHVTRNYFPRPPSLAVQEAQAPAQRKGARHSGLPADVEAAPQNAGLPGKGMVPTPQVKPVQASPPPPPPPPVMEEPLAAPTAGDIPGATAKTAVPTAAPMPLTTRGNIRETGTFTAEDVEISRTAWRYFVENYQTNTGLVNSVHNYPYATLWDLGSNLAAYACAMKLNLISPTEGKKKITRFLETLQVMELYNHELPNREYLTKTGEMTDLSSRPSSVGSGWSALDIGRLLIWLKITAAWYPDFAPLVDKVVDRWTFDRLVQYRELNGVLFNGEKEWLRQEGRLGYEQYAASGVALFGQDVRQALDYKETDSVTILQREVLFDTRNNAFFTSDPFVMTAMELGHINGTFTDLTRDVYDIQRRRWLKSEEVTAVNEDAVSKDPWFVYTNLYYEGTPWACVTHDGTPADAFFSLSTKAALGWSALFDDAYATALRQAVIGLKHPRYGFYAGVYPDGTINTSRNINTNAVILEAMLYLKRGATPFLTEGVLP
ncbi:consensus disorder prediction [Desulfoluna spongiiphila]|nr:consensus disorder prediction [Desulfoluna spongiiphila]